MCKAAFLTLTEEMKKKFDVLEAQYIKDEEDKLHKWAEAYEYFGIKPKLNNLPNVPKIPIGKPGIKGGRSIKTKSKIVTKR